MGKEYKKLLSIFATAVASQANQTAVDKEAIKRQAEKINRRLQQAALMVGIASNILLDNLNTLSNFQVVWAKEIKRTGNLFITQLVKAESKIWNHAGDNQDLFLELSQRLEQALHKVVNMQHKQLVQLIVAIDQIVADEVLQIEESQLESLLNTRDVLEKAIAYIASKPKIGQIEVLQYLRTLLNHQQ